MPRRTETEPPDLTLPEDLGDDPGPLPEATEADLEPEEPESPSPRRRRRRKAKAASTSSVSSSATRSPSLADRFAPAWEKEIRKGYTEALVLVGGVSMLALPVTGRVMAGRAPYTADVLVRLARTDERIRGALLAILRYGTFLELLMIVGSFGLAVNVDFYISSKGQRGVAPDNPAVGLLIGAEVQDALNAEQQRTATAGAANGQQPVGAAAPWVGVPTSDT